MREKLKIYLDTNVIYDWFQKRAEKIDEQEFTVQKIAFIKENLEFLEVYTSFFTLIEIANRLKEDFRLKSTLINEELQSFASSFPLQIIKSIRLGDKGLEYFLAGISWKDSIQLNIAMNENLILITQDKKLHRKGRKFYKEITNLSGLRRRIDRIRNKIKEGSYLLKYF